MNILISQTDEIKTLLTDINQIIESKRLSNSIMNKIKITNDKLLEITNNLEKLKLDIKNECKISLTNEEKQYLEDERKTNQFICQLIPAFTMLNFNDNN